MFPKLINNNMLNLNLAKQPWLSQIDQEWSFLTTIRYLFNTPLIEVLKSVTQAGGILTP